MARVCGMLILAAFEVEELDFVCTMALHGSAPASYVIARQLFGAAFAIINLHIVIKEIRKRQRDQAKFNSCSSKWLSLFSIIGGFLVSFTYMMHHVNGFCYLVFPLHNYIGNVLPICVGFYQLSRLYQCFAGNNVSGGYPKWLFYLMTTFGILYLLIMVPYILLNYIFLDCGLTKHYEFEGTTIDGWGDKKQADFTLVAVVLYLIWDIAILLLLVTKVRSLIGSASKDSVDSEFIIIGIHKNMTRIVILTIFYMTMQAVDTIYFFIYNIRYLVAPWAVYIDTGSFLILNSVMSYAVFLMQHHNSMEYGVFLIRAIFCKLHYCCCRYYRDVLDQRDHFLATYGVIESGMELETPLIDARERRRETGTAYNEFSTDDLPNNRYQPSIVPHTIRRTTMLKIVAEHEVKDDEPRPNMRKQTRDDVLRNDFLFEEDCNSKEGISGGFSFGVYLEYWRRNRHNTVLPKYATLREELTMNRYATITEEEYERLQRECKLLQVRHKFTANSIGTMNTVCGITPDSDMTVEHMICIKLYTDFTAQQAIFKKHCRRLYREESIESVMKRNSEIAHWCRLLKESVMFFGQSMTASEMVYCGLNSHLIFNSLHQRFECPLSTSKQLEVAEKFSMNDETGHHGVILLLQRANSKTKYFNVVPFTAYQHEDERLFMGSTLKIVDIRVDGTSLKEYISALLLFEQILHGHFLQTKKQARKLLLSILNQVNQQLRAQTVKGSNALKSKGINLVLKLFSF